MADQDSNVTIEVDIKGMERFKGKLNSRSSPIMDKMYIQWAERLRSYWKERFDTWSKGGGAWVGLSKETIRRRKKGKDGTKTASILRNTNTLYKAIDPKLKSPGKLTNKGKNYIEIGYGGPDKHPSVNATIAQVATWHQTGAGFNPVRKIIVNPNARTRKGMEEDADRALAKLSKQTGNQ